MDFRFPAFLVAGAASALPPPAGCCPEAGWDGPGRLCESGFALRVAANEFVREDLQLEPSQPASNTVKSPTGWYTIAIVERRADRPRRRDRLRLVRETEAGRLFEYSPSRPHLAARFVHIPRRSGRPWLEVGFWKAIRSDTADWRLSPQTAYPVELYAGVLERISFETACPPEASRTR